MKRMNSLTILIILVPLIFIVWYVASSHASQTRIPSAPLTASEQEMAERLREHVTRLAETIGERNLWSFPQLEAAANYIEGQLQRSGFKVERQIYSVAGKQVSNLAVEIPGNVRPEEIMLVGAHYDSVAGSPGANDNASGVAALLELAGQIADTQPALTLRLVAFVNEEPPLFKSGSMGSLVYARAARDRGENIIAMLCLETIGYYSQREKSQQFPSSLLRFYYPTTGNFLAFVTNFSSRQLLRKSLNAFRSSSNFPAEGLIAPSWLPGIDWSDHWSFWQIDVPAIMLTDSALYRYPHYHSRQDSPDKLNYPEFARAVDGIIGMVGEMAD